MLAEAPSYVGALSTFAAYQVDVVHVAMDEEGLVPEALRDALDAVARAGKRVKFLYTVPSYHNPAGVTQGPLRRQEILEVAQRQGCSCSRTTPTACWASTGSCRRRCAPTTPTASSTSGRSPRSSPPDCGSATPSRRTACARSSCWPQRRRCCVRSAYSQLTVSTYLATEPWLDQVKTFRELYRERRDSLLGALEAMMPAGTTWTRPTGGFYSWVTLPEGLDAGRDAAPSGDRAGGLRARHGVLRGVGQDRPRGPRLPCGCRTATPNRTGSGKASGAWRPSSRRSSS